MTPEDQRTIAKYLAELSEDTLKIGSAKRYIPLKLGDGAHSDAINAYPKPIRCFVSSEELRAKVGSAKFEIKPINLGRPRDENWFRIMVSSSEEVVRHTDIFRQLVEESVQVVRHRQEGLTTKNG
jgi:hypothetical protein